MSKTLALVASTTLLMACASAQEPSNRNPGSQQPSTTESRDRSSGQQQGQQESDQILATWLLVDNENEVALARIAQQRASSQEVKQFAQKMIDDHTQMVQKLQQVAGQSGQQWRTGQGSSSGTGRDPSGSGTGNTGRDPNAGGGTGNTGRDPNAGGGTGNTGRDPNAGGGTGNTGRDPNAGGGTGGTGGVSGQGREPQRSGQPGQSGAMFGNLDHARLIRDLGRKHLESCTQILQEKQGTDFDKMYMGMMLGAHTRMEDMVEVFRNYGSERLRPILDEGLQTVQAHKEHAKDLARRTEQLAQADNIRGR